MQIFLNDEDQYIKAKNIFVKKCFEYEDHDYFKNILQTIMKKDSQKYLSTVCLIGILEFF